jgi:RimJ/RimL family protein N-acetyltransferase
MHRGPHRHRAGSISLRPVEADDLPVLFEHQHDPAACAMAAFPARERDDFMAHWERIATNPSVTSRTVLLGDAVVGNIVAFDYEGRREVGYWIGRQWWGRGVATRALVEFLTVETTRPIYAGVAPSNAGSIRVLEKCGFARCGEQDGHIDLVLDD